MNWRLDQFMSHKLLHRTFVLVKIEETNAHSLIQ